MINLVQMNPHKIQLKKRIESNELWRKNNQSDSPVGRLKSAKSAWETAGANEYIMRVVTEGYTLPFRELPPIKRMQNNKSAREMKKVNKQCLLDTPRTVRVSEKTWQVIVRTRRP